MKFTKKNLAKCITLAILIALLIISRNYIVDIGLDQKGISALIITLIGIFLWFTKMLPPAVTSILIICLYPLFNVIDFKESASSLGEDVIWMIIVMLLMGLAVEETGLDKRVSFSILSFSKGRPNYIILSLIIISFVLTFFIPNAIGRVVVLLPIVLGIINSLKLSRYDNLTKSSMISITLTPLICSIAIITGATGTIYASSLFESMLNFRWGYLDWLIVMLPLSIALLIGLWIILIIIMPSKSKFSEDMTEYIYAEKSKLGAITRQEMTLLFLYSVLIILWITQNLTGLPIPMSAMIVSIFLFVPQTQLLDWDKAIKRIDWGVPLLFAAGFTIAKAFANSGVVEWVSDYGFVYLQDINIFMLVLSLLIILTLIRTGFTNMTAMIASMMPIALTFAVGTNYNTLWLGMICIVGCSIGYMFPSQSVGTMTTFSYNYYSSKDLFYVGLSLTILVYILTILAAFLYWPYIGITID